MANLKEIRKRIDSVDSTKQITSAMKLVAASRLRKAQGAILKLRPYANKLTSIMQNVSTDLDNNESVGKYTEQRVVEKVLLIPVSSNKGLCGAFNANVTKEIIRLIKEDYAEQFEKGNLDIITVGKKVNEFLRVKGYDIKDDHNSLWEDMSYERVGNIASEIMEMFAEGEYDKVILVYNRFKNAATQVLQSEQFLPVLPPQGEESMEDTDYIYEPDKKTLIENLIPQTLRIQFYKVILDSNASEHGSRMTAMHKATDNADELIKDLKLHYNKVRQATITNEIIEIVGGAEALRG